MEETDKGWWWHMSAGGGCAQTAGMHTCVYVQEVARHRPQGHTYMCVQDVVVHRPQECMCVCVCVCAQEMAVH